MLRLRDFTAAVIVLASAASGTAFAQSAGTGYKQVILTPNSPAAIDPYYQAILAGNMFFLAGLNYIDPKIH